MKNGGRRSSKRDKKTSRSKRIQKQTARTIVSGASKTGKSGRALSPHSIATKKKIGGVRITLTRVNDTPPSRRISLPWPPGNCVCGKTNQQCGDEWDARLGITSRDSESYRPNLEKVRRAELDGLDPYCRIAQQKASGYSSDWTPYMPPGSFDPVANPFRMEATNGQTGNRITSSGGSRSAKRVNRGAKRKRPRPKSL